MQARSLRYLDVSDTNWDRKGVEYLVQALNTPRSSSHSTDAVPPETPLKAEKLLGVRGKRAQSEPSHSPSSIQLVENANDPSEDSESETEVEKIEAEKEEEMVEAISMYGSFIPPAPLLKASTDEDAPTALHTLRMDGCAFRGNVLEALGKCSRAYIMCWLSTLTSWTVLAQGIRSSDLRNVSLRRNKIGPLGAVALALMIRDYPESAISMSAFSPGLSASLSSTSLASIEQQLSPSPSPIPYRQRLPQSSPLKSVTALPPVPAPNDSSSPIASKSMRRTISEEYRPPSSVKPRRPISPNALSPSRDTSDLRNASLNRAHAEGKLTSAEMGGASMALQRSVRALDGVERIGRLLTLDLKGNDIRVSATLGKDLGVCRILTTAS